MDTLPPDCLTTIMAQLANTSYRSFTSLRLCSWTLYTTGLEARVLYKLSFIACLHIVCQDPNGDFIHRVMASRNPNALYLTACANFVSLDTLISSNGYSMLQSLKNEGHRPSLFAWAIASLFYSNNRLEAVRVLEEMDSYSRCEVKVYRLMLRLSMVSLNDRLVVVEKFSRFNNVCDGSGLHQYDGPFIDPWGTKIGYCSKCLIDYHVWSLTCTGFWGLPSFKYRHEFCAHVQQGVVDWLENWEGNPILNEVFDSDDEDSEDDNSNHDCPF